MYAICQVGFKKRGLPDFRVSLDDGVFYTHASAEYLGLGALPKNRLYRWASALWALCGTYRQNTLVPEDYTADLARL